MNLRGSLQSTTITLFPLNFRFDMSKSFIDKTTQKIHAKNLKEMGAARTWSLVKNPTKMSLAID